MQCSFATPCMHAVQRLEWQPPAHITSELSAVVRIALELRGCHVRTEVAVSYAGIHGGFDLAAYDEDRRLAVAVEIDHSNKPRSLAKPQAAAAIGAVPLWIRWGHDAAQ